MNSAGEDEVSHKGHFFRLLLIPCLVFSNVLIALNWDTDEITCSSDGDLTASGLITLEGVEYDVYTFLYDDLDSGGSFKSGDGGCDLSDWDIRTADHIDVGIRTSEYSAYDACSDYPSYLEASSECDDAVVHEGTTWRPMERCNNACMTRNLGPVGGYVTFEAGGWFGDGSFLIAVEPGIEITDFEVDVRPYDDILSPLVYSVFLTPVVLWFVNRWAKTNRQPHLRPGAMVLGKNVLKVAVVHGLSFISLILLDETLSGAALFALVPLILLTPSLLVYAERKRRLSRLWTSIFVFLLVPIQVVLLFVAGQGGPLGCHGFLTSPEVNPLDTHPSVVYYLWLGSHVPLLWHYLTARRLQHPLLYTIVIPVLFVFLIDMSISHTAMLAGYGEPDDCSEYQSASIRYTIGTVSLLLLAGSMTWARRYHRARRTDSDSDAEDSVVNAPSSREETLRQAQAMGLQLSDDGLSWVPMNTKRPPNP